MLYGPERATKPGDWEQDARYENIIRLDAVRAVITQQAANARQGVSGESLLALYDKIVASPIPLKNLVAIVQPLYASWGIGTGKQRTDLIEIPIGRVIAHTLCSFAKHGQAFQSAQQHDTGCVLNADLPSSVCALKGNLTISLLRHELHTQVTATTSIPGQLYDWGKSHRCLEQFFIDLKSDLGLPASVNLRQVA